jgi:hypothetical protein
VASVKKIAHSPSNPQQTSQFYVAVVSPTTIQTIRLHTKPFATNVKKTAHSPSNPHQANQFYVKIASEIKTSLFLNASKL